MEAKVVTRLNEKKRNPVLRYEEYAYYQFADCGEGARLRESRQSLHDLAKDNEQAVRVLDEIVIEAAIANDYVNPVLVADNEAEPLQNWWWHLGKIRAKTYPLELLPKALQDVYLDTDAS